MRTLEEKEIAIKAIFAKHGIDPGNIDVGSKAYLDATNLVETTSVQDAETLDELAEEWDVLFKAAKRTTP